MITIPGPVYILIQFTAGVCTGFWLGLGVKKLLRFAKDEYQTIKNNEKLRSNLEKIYRRPQH